MEPAPGEPGGSGASEADSIAPLAAGRNARAQPDGDATELTPGSTAQVEPGNSGASAGCTPQQSPHCSVAAELQSPMANPSQQDRCPEDARQASAGMNA
ncbi:MAG TPA: hypothetical protein VGG42_05110, partial [Acidobacteriaceae bacterium]